MHEASQGKSWNRILLPPGGGGSVLAWPGQRACEGAEQEPESGFLQVSARVEDGSALATDSIEAAILELTWGNAGHHAFCDLIRGVAVTLVGPIQVHAQYPIAGGGVTQPRLTIFASIARGVKSVPGITHNARRTLTAGLVPAAQAGPGLSAILEIPEWAYAVALQTPTIANPVLELRQFLDSQAAVAVSAADIGKPDGSTVPIAQGARFCRLANPGAVEIANVRLTFYLGI